MDANGIPVSVCRAAKSGDFAPTAPANNASTIHAVKAQTRTLRIGHAYCWVVGIPVRTQFPHIPGHVVQSPRVRILASYRVVRVHRVALMPSYRFQFPRAEHLLSPHGPPIPTPPPSATASTNRPAIAVAHVATS